MRMIKVFRRSKAVDDHTIKEGYVRKGGINRNPSKDINRPAPPGSMKPKDNQMYIVRGGIYRDFDFLFVDVKEQYGPFASYDQAYSVWKQKVWLNVDNALHRLHVEKISATTCGMDDK